MNTAMKFDEIILGKLWATRYEGNEDNELQILFDQWSDPSYLYDFFKEHVNDLKYFNVTSIEEAVNDTMDDSEEMEMVFLDSKTNLEELFSPPPGHAREINRGNNWSSGHKSYLCPQK